MGRPKREVKISVTLAPEPMGAMEQAAAKRIIAELVARAFVADRPELFQERQAKRTEVEDGPADESG